MTKLINLVTNKHCPLIGLDLSWNELSTNDIRAIADAIVYAKHHYNRDVEIYLCGSNLEKHIRNAEKKYAAQ